MDDRHEPESTNPTGRRFQFGMKHLLAAPVVVALFLSLVTAFGIWWAVAASISGLMSIGLCFRPTRRFAAAALIVWVLWLLMVVSQLHPGAGESATCMNNLKNLSLALLCYEAEHGCFPPAYIADENGRPMHSWRVLILPYIERNDLWNAYRMDEPWDGPNNSKLADIDIGLFRCPGDTDTPATMTNYVAVVGPNTAWPGAQQTSLEDLSGGAARTILLVEVVNPGIHWMEPRDLHVLQMAPGINPTAGQGISSRHFSRGAIVAFADGHQELLPKDISAKELRAMLTRSGNEITDTNDPQH